MTKQESQWLLVAFKWTLPFRLRQCRCTLGSIVHSVSTLLVSLSLFHLYIFQPHLCLSHLANVLATATGQTVLFAFFLLNMTTELLLTVWINTKTNTSLIFLSVKPLSNHLSDEPFTAIYFYFSITLPVHMLNSILLSPPHLSLHMNQSLHTSDVSKSQSQPAAAGQNRLHSSKLFFFWIMYKSNVPTIKSWMKVISLILTGPKWKYISIVSLLLSAWNITKIQTGGLRVCCMFIKEEWKKHCNLTWLNQYIHEKQTIDL